MIYCIYCDLELCSLKMHQIHMKSFHGKYVTCVFCERCDFLSGFELALHTFEIHKIKKIVKGFCEICGEIIENILLHYKENHLKNSESEIENFKNWKKAIDIWFRNVL